MKQMMNMVVLGPWVGSEADARDSVQTGAVFNAARPGPDFVYAGEGSPLWMDPNWEEGMEVTMSMMHEILGVKENPSQAGQWRALARADIEVAGDDEEQEVGDKKESGDGVEVAEEAGTEATGDGVTATTEPAAEASAAPETEAPTPEAREQDE